MLVSCHKVMVAFWFFCKRDPASKELGNKVLILQNPHTCFTLIHYCLLHSGRIIHGLTSYHKLSCRSDSNVVVFVGLSNVVAYHLIKPPRQPMVQPWKHQSPLLFPIPMPFVPGSLPMQLQPKILLQISEGIINVRFYTYQMKNKESSIYTYSTLGTNGNAACILPNDSVKVYNWVGLAYLTIQEKQCQSLT